MRKFWQDKVIRKEMFFTLARLGLCKAVLWRVGSYEEDVGLDQWAFVNTDEVFERVLEDMRVTYEKDLER